MSNRLLIVDGDLVAYIHAAAAETRTIIAKHLNSGREKEFKTRTEFKKFLTDKNMTFEPTDYQITDHQHPVDISFAISTLNKSLKTMQESTWTDNVEVYIGSGKTFRHELPLPSAYKSNRVNLIKPVHLTAVRNHMKRKWKAKVIENGFEVDDVVTIRAYEALYSGQEAVLASTDKDSCQCQGIHLYNWSNENPKIELIPDVGNLRREKVTVKGDGLKFLAFQVLAGDTADTYQGYELSKLSYGPVKAMKALVDASTEKEVMQIMFDEFKRLYPEEFEYTDCHGKEHVATWKDMLQLYWKCAYMKRTWNDPSDVYDFMDERGIML